MATHTIPDVGTTHLIVACTNRKSQPVPAALQLRRVTAVDPARRALDWVRRLESCDTPRISATDLYAGEAWDRVRMVLNQPKMKDVSLWICSAGLGLLPGNSSIPAYSATFEPTHPDGIPGGTTGAEQWWNALQSWNGFKRGPRSIRKMVQRDRTARVIVVLSPRYLKACRSDLIAAAAELENPMQLSVISAGTKRDAFLGPFLLPVDSRLQGKVGGTKHSLNIRVAQALLESGDHSHRAMHHRLRQWTLSLPPLPRFDRRLVSDDQVRRFIRGRIQQRENSSHSRLLREFRTEGYACEQGRFARLFEEEKVSHVRSC